VIVRNWQCWDNQRRRTRFLGCSFRGLPYADLCDDTDQSGHREAVVKTVLLEQNNGTAQDSRHFPQLVLDSARAVSAIEGIACQVLAVGLPMEAVVVHRAVDGAVEDSFYGQCPGADKAATLENKMCAPLWVLILHSNLVLHAPQAEGVTNQRPKLWRNGLQSSSHTFQRRKRKVNGKVKIPFRDITI
jgi:hypothetical protein